MKCRDCIHTTKSNATVAMNKLGFRNCKYLPAYHFVSGINVCRINKFEAKA